MNLKVAVLPDTLKFFTGFILREPFISFSSSIVIGSASSESVVFFSTVSVCFSAIIVSSFAFFSLGSVATTVFNKSGSIVAVLLLVPL